MRQGARPLKTARPFLPMALLFPAFLAAATEPSDAFLKVKVEGIAEGAGTPGRVNAIHAAERRALTLAVAAILDTSFMDIAASLQRQPDRYVQTSRLISSQVQDGETHAVVEVYLRNHELRSDIAGAVFPRIHPRPRVLILVAEELAGQTFLNAATAGVVERALADAFAASGFNLVDSSQVRARYPAPELVNRAQGSPGAVARFALENQADLILVGEAYSRFDEAFGSGNLHRMVADMNLRLVRAIDGAVVDARTSKAAVHAVNPVEGARLALRDAAVKAKQPMMVSAALAMIGAGQRGHYIMAIESPGTRDFVDAVRDALENYPGINGVEVLRMAANEALLQFQYSGKMRPLVDTLESIEHPRFKLVPDQIVGRQMNFRTVVRE